MVGKRCWLWWPHITSHCSEKGLERHTTVFWSQVLFDSVFFFSGTIWDAGSCVRQVHPLFQNRNHFGVERMISLFPGWETASVLLQPMSQQYCSRKKSYWHLTKKTTINCHWDGALFLQNSIPASCARQLIEYPEKEVKEQEWSGKFNWCQEAAGEGPNSVARSTVFEMPVPVFS